MDDNEKAPEQGVKCTVDELIEYCRNLSIKWVPTEKNKEFRYKTGLDIDEILNSVRTLRKEYFLEEIDDLSPGYSGKMYVFKRLINEKYYCYIKIKINRTSNGMLVLVVSFHDDESLY